MQKHWGVILNPKAGDKKISGKQTISEALKSGGIDGDFRYSEYAGHATVLARELVAAGYRHVLVVGGDGTISEVVDGLMTSGVDSRELTFAILPSGTGNDWCRYWNIGKRIDECLAHLEKGRTKRVDVGCLTYNKAQDVVTKYFINSVGLGFDAEIVSRAEQFGNFAKGISLNYLFALIVCAVTHKSKPILFEADNDTFNGDFFTMSIANGPYTGGGIKQTPDADPTDGQFDVLLASRPTVYQTIRDISRVLFRRGFGGVLHLYRTSKVRLTSQERHKVEADGIIQDGAEAPFNISIVPGALNMIVRDEG